MRKRTARNLCVNLLQLALCGPTAAFGQLAGPPFRYTVPVAPGKLAEIGLKGAAIGYESTAPKDKILDVQYAILHAMLDWSKDYDKGYPALREAELKLLTESRISVTPLKDKAARGILETALSDIRGMRNYGRPHAKTPGKPPISLQRMSELHRDLIRSHAGSIHPLAPGKTAAQGGPGKLDSEQAKLHYALTQRLLGPIKAMNDAPDDGQFLAAVALFNDVAVKFGKGHYVLADSETRPSAAISEALRIYAAERALALTSGAATAEEAGKALPEASTLADKAKLDSWFDKSRPQQGQPPPPPKVEKFDKTAELAENPPAVRPETVPPAPEKEPNKKRRDGHSRGLFGMLGSLFKGLCRTVARVAAAAFKGVVGIAKAAVS